MQQKDVHEKFRREGQLSSRKSKFRNEAWNNVSEAKLQHREGSADYE
jgi:hypothetical protein